MEELKDGDFVMVIDPDSRHFGMLGAYMETDDRYYHIMSMDSGALYPFERVQIAKANVDMRPYL